MSMADVLEYTQSVVLGLIVSFLLAKLFSIVFSSGDESHSLTGTNRNERQAEVVPPVMSRKSAEMDKRSDAEFSRKRITGGEKELLMDRRSKTSATGSDSDDDWEGVETTELDQAFCAATEFVAAIAADRSSQKVSNSFRLKLYGLYKIATEGACSVPQPSAIKITARAKWNAWHKLGAMSQEEAMQKYLEIITELYPNWADGLTSMRRGGDTNEITTKAARPQGPDFSSVHEGELKLDAINDLARKEQSPLLSAVDRDQTDVADILPGRNDEINLKDNEGQTPLHHAADCEPDDTGVEKNAATCIQNDDHDGTVYPSDLSQSNWHSIQP